MNKYCRTKVCTAIAFVTLVTTVLLNQHCIAQQAPVAPQNGVEVLTRGPVHEAFAETITFNPQPGIAAPKVPPAAIEEVPPQQRPEGRNVSWIPGYWGWDDERNDFLWISGIWRSLPPGRQWVPGYWGQSPQGAQWTSGYWADAAANEIQYLPEPPASVEQGPNIEATSADQTWLPGCWIWQQDRYAWRPGYWAVGNQDWDWTPDHYVWTPSGYIFVDGYYDYSVPRRGVLFAPVYFDAGVRAQRGFSYSPSAVINPGVFANHLFLRPSYGHYYFGDYYASNYTNAGFSPWYSYQSSRRGYDPIYAGQRWQHRQDRNWEQRTEANYRNYRDHEDTRPPRTWAAQRELAGRGTRPNGVNSAVATSLDDLTRQKDSGVRFQPVDRNDQQQFGQRGRDYRKYLEQRQQLEAHAARKPGDNPSAANPPARKPFSRSPYVAAPADQLGKNDAPPQRHVVLKPDSQVQPAAGTPGGHSGARQVRKLDAIPNRPQQQKGPPAKRDSDARGQQQPQNANQNKAKGNPNRPAAQAPQKQPKGESKKSDKGKD